MKLTNEQVNVLVAAFREEITAVKKTLRESPEYQARLQELRSTYNIEKLTSLLEEDIEIGNKIDALQQERGKLRNACIEELQACGLSFNSYNIKTYGLKCENVESQLVNIVENEMFPAFPSDNKIKSAIILETVAGKSDIFNTLKEKFLNF